MAELPAHDANSFSDMRPTIVQRLHAGDAAVMEDFLRIYGIPLRNLAKRLKIPNQDPEDAVQGFIGRVIDKPIVLAWDPAKGRFGPFLRSVFIRFLIDGLRHANGVERGGGKSHIALDGQPSEIRDALICDALICDALVQNDTAEDELRFDYDWAQGIFDRAMQQHKDDYANTPGRLRRFELINPRTPVADYAAAAVEWDMPVKSIIEMASRVRRAFRECLHAEIEASSKASGHGGHLTDAEIKEEMRYLHEVLQRGPRRG